MHLLTHNQGGKTTWIAYSSSFRIALSWETSGMILLSMLRKACNNNSKSIIAMLEEQATYPTSATWMLTSPSATTCTTCKPTSTLSRSFQTRVWVVPRLHTVRNMLELMRVTCPSQMAWETWGDREAIEGMLGLVVMEQIIMREGLIISRILTPPMCCMMMTLRSRKKSLTID